ncbi:hypothetical protein MUK42_17989 [Musa troglodytarum]|uniref:Uncharacterized protein n=1 Tax=Musa troglodytarum TaxID=320322 RepID=A0A9E7HD30_9LILI|nr:hypothetical protein MUK42_17989 [Musa troglodytarum]
MTRTNREMLSINSIREATWNGSRTKFCTTGDVGEEEWTKKLLGKMQLNINVLKYIMISSSSESIYRWLAYKTFLFTMKTVLAINRATFALGGAVIELSVIETEDYSQ